MSAPAHAPGFRNYGEDTRATVHELYRLNHRHQTLDFVRAKKRQYLSLDRKRMTVLEALERVETLVDDSDPDIDPGQIEHARRPPRRFALTGTHAGSS
jgi:inositol oxygenase